MKPSPNTVDRFVIDDNEKFVIESLGKNIRLPERYKYIRPIGSGGGGMVLHAHDIKTGTDVAIKKILSPFNGPEMSKRCLREIHLLRTVKHPNIIPLLDAFLAGHNPDLYFVMRYMPTDMRKLLKDQTPLPLAQTRSFAYQLLAALSHMHELGIVHRDLKPENLLLDYQGTLVICDLGLARPADLHMTGYVSTRFYRAPEIMLSWKQYTESVDVWSAGCIISEMLTGHVLFPGMDHIHHINLILELLGSPTETVLDRLCGETTKKYLLMLPHSDGMDFGSTIFNLPHIPDDAVDLMQSLLVLDPTARITAAAALNHPFFDEVRSDSHANVQQCTRQAPAHDPTGFDQLSLPELRAAIEAEVGLFDSGTSRHLIEKNPMGPPSG